MPGSVQGDEYMVVSKSNFAELMVWEDRGQRGKAIGLESHTAKNAMKEKNLGLGERMMG